ncbi:MAG TPA: hypothetical protein VLM89_11730, partial [Phycisphaerae bacterium]|nr:hypothetical protein [Phycisphaerae bacterium]
RIGQERETRAADAVAERVANEQDRLALEMAGYAAARTGQVSLIDALQRRADAEPDDTTRTQLIIFAARLARGQADLSAWLDGGLAVAEEPWRQLGCAAGLLEFGQPRGGPALMALARKPDHPATLEALNWLQRLVGPMTETVGWPIEWPTKGEPPDEAFWDSLERFWSQHADSRLIADVLDRLYIPDPRLAELRRLIHARKKVARWFE